MKLVIGAMILAATAAIGIAQDVQPAVRAKLVAELAAASAGHAVKNAPFSADEVSESVQTLADGNRIVRSSTGKFYRNSEGRIRREHSGGTGGMMGSFYTTGSGVSIISPAEGHRYLLDSEQKTARVIESTRAQGELAIAGAKAASKEDREKAVVELRRQIETEAGSVSSVAIVGSGTGTGTGYSTVISGTGQGAYAFSTGNSRFETRNEELGTRDFEGVSATGTRRVTTIPAGAIGNEQPIETVYERWYSQELGMVVYSKNSDPRFGEQTYRLTNIVRAEPDPSLFSVPTGYRKVGEPGTVYRINNPRTESVRPVTAAKAVKAPTPAANSRP